MRRQVIFFKSHQGLDAGCVVVKYNANTWVQGSTMQVFIPRSLVRSQTFFDFDLELLKLPYCYHCLLSIFSKILSSHTMVWILATAFRHLLVLETVLPGAESMRRRKHIPYVSGNLLRSSRDHVGKEDSRLGWSECDGSYHGKRDRQMDYDCFISISKSAWLDSILKTGLLG
jgi:hypothetical protein